MPTITIPPAVKIVFWKSCTYKHESLAATTLDHFFLVKASLHVLLASTTHARASLARPQRAAIKASPILDHPSLFAGNLGWDDVGDPKFTRRS